MAKNEVVKKEDESQLPAYLRGRDTPVDNGDNFDQSDIVLPQIKLLQGTSEECTDFAEANPGNFWHTGMDMNLGESVEFIVVSKKKKYLLQAPMDDGQGILARAEDATTWDRTGEWIVKVDPKTKVTWAITDLNVKASGLTEWGTYDPDMESSPPAATLFYEYLVIMPEHLDLGPAIISLARSAIRKAKKGLNDKLTLHANNGRPQQAIRFAAKAVGDQNDSGQDYFNWQFTGAGFAEEDHFNLATNFAETLTDYKVQDEGQQDDVKAPADDGGGDF